MPNEDVQLWVQIGITAIAAISYLLLYKQQQSLSKNYETLLSKYKEGYSNLSDQLDIYKKLFSMEGMQNAIEHNIAIRTPEIERQLIQRIHEDGHQIINVDAILELLAQIYRTSSWMYHQEMKDAKERLEYEDYLKITYPESSDIIIWYIQLQQPELSSTQEQA